MVTTMYVTWQTYFYFDKGATLVYSLRAAYTPMCRDQVKCNSIIQSDWVNNVTELAYMFTSCLHTYVSGSSQM